MSNDADNFSSRNFFSLRFVVPSITFFIGMLSISPFFLLIRFNIDTLSLIDLIIGVFSIIGISAFGVIISQTWHMIFNAYRYFKGTTDLKHLRDKEYTSKIVSDKYTIKESIGNNYRFLINLRDYLFNHLMLKNTNYNNIRSFLSRRWDLFNLFGSSLLSYGMGFITGLFLNIWIFEKYTTYMLLNNRTIIFEFLNNTSIKYNNVSKIIIATNNIIIPKGYYYFTLIFSIFLIIIPTVFSLWWIQNERKDIIMALLNEIDIPIEDIVKAFPNITPKKVQPPNCLKKKMT